MASESARVFWCFQVFETQMTIIWHILFRWNIYDADAGAFFGSALRTLGHFEPVLFFFVFPLYRRGSGNRPSPGIQLIGKWMCSASPGTLFCVQSKIMQRRKWWNNCRVQILSNKCINTMLCWCFWFQSSCIAVRCAGALACKNQFSCWILVHRFKYLDVAKPERLLI